LNYGASFTILGTNGGRKVTNLRSPASVFLYADSLSAYLYGAASGAGLSGYGSPYCAWGVNTVSAVAAGHRCRVAADGMSAIGCDNGHIYRPAAAGGGRNYDRVRDLMGRHFDGLNVCYADGHVAWISGAKMVALSRPGIAVEQGGLSLNGDGGGNPWNPDYAG
jgi:prepilin-type processing-associated H-X9-DG protein